MKKLTTFITLLLLCATALFAQAPEKFTYQAVVRNASNALVANTQVGIRVNILQGTATGSAVYSESHVLSTNANGLVTVNIGGGSVLHGSFAGINWADGPYFLKTDIDPNGGNDYSIITTQQLLSVPYALYAKDAGNGFSGDYNDLTNTPTIPTVPTDVSAFNNDAGYLTSFSETDPQYNAWNKDYNDLINKPIIPTVPSNVSTFVNDAGYITAAQVPVQVNADWNATSGAAQILNKPTLFSGNYYDLTNKPTLFDGNYNSLSNKPNLSAVAISGNYNDLNNKPTIPTVPSNVSAFTNDAGYLTAETPQLLSMNGNQLTISGGNTIIIPSSSGAPGADGRGITNIIKTATNGLVDTYTIYYTIGEPTTFTVVNGATGATGLTGPQGDQGPAGPQGPAGVSPTISVQQLGSIIYIHVTNADGSTNTYSINTTASTGEFTQVQANWTEEDNTAISYIQNKPNFASVATSGDYNDLTNKPTIPSVPTVVSAFNNDAGYITMADIQALIKGLNNRIDSLENIITNCCGSHQGDSSTSVIQPAIYIDAIEYITETSAIISIPLQMPAGCLDVTNLGYLWGLSTNLTDSGNIQVLSLYGVGGTTYTSTLTGLTPNTTYYVMAYATTNLGTVYSNMVSFTTTCPLVEIHGNNNIQLGQTITLTATGGESYIWSTGATGSSITVSPTSSGTYFVTTYNSYGCTSTASFLVTVDISNVQLPTVTTGTATNITTFSATCSGNVTSDGGATITQRGICWSTSANPTISSNHLNSSSGTGSFTVNLTGLSAGTTYYARAYATNAAGTAYGNQITFMTTSVCPTSTVSDYDGNIYNTIAIGNQCWMKENLRTTHYSDGTYIAVGSSASTTTAYRYSPNNTSSYVTQGLGYLYNWKAVRRNSNSSSTNPSGVQGICPNGWHVPSRAEYLQLISYVGSQSSYICSNNSSYVAKALASTSSWWSTSSTECSPGYNRSSNNATGFGAVPAGGYYGNSTNSGFSTPGQNAEYWTITQENESNANSQVYYFSMFYISKAAGCDVDFDGNVNHIYGRSIRCLRD